MINVCLTYINRIHTKMQKNMLLFSKQGKF